jgi:hypothetical protein
MECTLAGETEVLGENLPQLHFPSQNLTWPDPGLNQGRRGGKPVTNRLSYSAALVNFVSLAQDKSPQRWIFSLSNYRQLKFFLIRLVGEVGWSPTGSTRHWCHQHVYCAIPGWLWWWRNWWNNDWQEKLMYSDKTCFIVALSITNHICSVRTRTRVAAVGSQRLTAWSTARPTTDDFLKG